MNLKDKNLLVISPFPDKDGNDIGGVFVKNQISIIKDNFNEVFVIEPIPYVPKFLRSNPRLIKKDYKYDNVGVYFPRFFMLPIKKDLFDVFRFKAVDDVIRKHKLKFDLIHAHFIWPCGYIGSKLKEKYKKPLIVTSHEDHNSFIEEIKSKRSIFVFSVADKILRVNKRDLNELKSISVNNGRLEYILNGYNKSRFYPMNKVECRKKLSLPNDKIVLLNIANLETYKGQEYLIDAVEKISKIRKDFVCVICGHGTLKDKLEEKIKRLRISEFIKIVPDRHDEIPLWMNACDIFVLSSISEGNPTVMFEALGCGKPFVGTSVGGVPEIIINDDLGFLCKSKDSEALSKILLKALDKKWDKEYILNYSQQFTTDKISEELKRIYSEAIKKYQNE